MAKLIYIANVEQSCYNITVASGEQVGQATKGPKGRGFVFHTTLLPKVNGNVYDRMNDSAAGRGLLYFVGQAWDAHKASVQDQPKPELRKAG